MIRLAVPSDFDRIMEVYGIAKAFMDKMGNTTQWQGGYPHADLVRSDIANGNMHVLTSEDGQICGCFTIFEGEDPTYTYIEGKWESDTPYIAIHRVASDGTERGIFGRIFEFAAERYDHIRIDTHEDNIPMQRALSRCGFNHCGTIYVYDGTPRMAYEWFRR